MSFILSAIAIVSGFIGVKKGWEALQNQSEAREIHEKSKSIVQNARRQLEAARNQAVPSLEALGRLKLAVWAGTIADFSDAIIALSSRRLRLFLRAAGKSQPSKTNLNDDFLPKRAFEQMKTQSLNAADILKGGTATIASGSLLAMATYGAVSTLGVASTGTAIATLSGIAAQNATLAWLGGGALVSGGGGIAAGVSVLGGIVLAPAFAVFGIIMAGKAHENLEAAKANYRRACEAAETMKDAASKLDRLTRLSGKFYQAIQDLNSRFGPAVRELRVALEQSYAEAEARSTRSIWRKMIKAVLGLNMPVRVHRINADLRIKVKSAFEMAVALRNLLCVPLMSPEGRITDEPFKVLLSASAFIQERQAQR